MAKEVWTDQDGRKYPIPVKQRENRSDSGGSVRAYLLNRAKPHLPPWLTVGGVGLAGGGSSLMWEGSAAAGVGLTLASVALTGVTWWAGRSTSAQRRLHSAVTVAAGSAWFTAAALAGPLAGPLPDLFLMGGATLALSWNVRLVLRTPEAAGEDSDKGLLAKVGLAKAQIGQPRVEPNKVTVPYALPAGEGTNQDVSKALPGLAAALDVPANAVRNRPDPDSAARGTFTIVPKDMLRDVIWYPGPSNPGGSIAEPIVIGVYEDGRELQLTIPDALHLLIMGMTGSGKTEGAIDVLCEVFSRRDVIGWLSDPKRGQDLGEAFAACDWVVDTPAGAEMMIEALKVVVPARQKWLGDHGYRSWEPAAAEVQNDSAHSCQKGRACGCPGMPYLVAWFEEAANTLRATDDDVFTGIAQEARSAGAWLVISMQRASGYQISTDTRASLPASLCFGVEEKDAQFALPSEVLDAGANPGAWGNKRPGYNYLVAKGIDEELWSTPARTFRNDPVSLEWVAREFAPVRMGVDPVTAAAAASVAGRAYIDRMADQAPAEEEDDMQHEPSVDPEDVDIDPEAELPEAEQGDDAPIFGQDMGRKPKGEEARRLFEEALQEFERNGQMVVGPKDFHDWCEKHHLSRPWVSGQLKEAYKRGRVEDTGTTGRWRIVPALTPA
ncbi:MULTISPECIES: plasmid transfer protein TraB [unclassified Streptomyces]|uniref:plasmid transfer protein TraB n=1 Tax=unclassified Streptomyces TaxID=2593676 RepID=UPI0033B0B010